ncbi:MAG: OmpA family protein [Lachnospiraceae bacterium]|nr:OmpA family protein [Lachnospiraceae bacterium]
MHKLDQNDSEKDRRRKKPANVWRSYSDMMSGLLLLFLLVMAVCFIESQRSYEAELEAQASQLELSEQLDEQIAEMEEQQAKMDEQESELEEKQSLLEEQQKLLEEQQSLLDEQTSQLEEQQQVMAEQQEKIDNIIGIKAELIAALKEEFSAQNLSVGIDEETGAITFDSNVLFAYNESVLTDEGTELLSQMLPIYCSILLSEDYSEYLSEILVDGYTDTVGSYDYNLQLSQSRAYAVASYLLSVDDQFLDEEQVAMLETKLSVNGHSKSSPIYAEDGSIDADASRRVEVKFRLADDEMITELQKIMNES